MWLAIAALAILEMATGIQIDSRLQARLNSSSAQAAHSATLLAIRSDASLAVSKKLVDRVGWTPQEQKRLDQAGELGDSPEEQEKLDEAEEDKENGGTVNWSDCPPSFMILNVDQIQPKCTDVFERADEANDPKPTRGDHKLRPFYKNRHGMYLHFWVGAAGDINNWVCGPSTTHETGELGFVSSFENGDVDCPDGGFNPSYVKWEAMNEGVWSHLGDNGEPILVMQTALAREKLQEAVENQLAAERQKAAAAAAKQIAEASPLKINT